MYIPDHFALTDPQAIRDTIAAHPLAVFVTNGAEGPELTHLPLIARDEDGALVLYGHFARANTHWKRLGGTPALAVFRGAQGYVTPGWYATKRETGKVVPTWNYVTVQVRGVPEVLEPGAPTRRAVDLLTGAMEAGRAVPWQVADAPESYTEAMLRGIVAFRMAASSIEAKAKLSQNRTDADFAGARDGFAAEGADAMAEAMRAAKPMPG